MAFTVWFLTTLSAGVAAYCGAYLKQKGQNLATHEDIEKLVAQMKATTEATKAIEERISNEFWNKQRVWEMKRDTLLGLSSAIVVLEDLLAELNTDAKVVNAMTTAADSPMKDAAHARMQDALQRWQMGWRGLINKRNEVIILCTPPIRHAVRKYQTELVRIFKSAKDGQVTNFVEAGTSLDAAKQPIYDAIREELSIENLA